MTDKTVQVVCEEDDVNKDTIANRLSLVHDAVTLDVLVGISCVDTETKEDTTVLAVMTKDSGEGLVQYAPIGLLLPPDDKLLQRMSPKLTAYIVPEQSDVQH